MKVVQRAIAIAMWSTLGACAANRSNESDHADAGDRSMRRDADIESPSDGSVQDLDSGGIGDGGANSDASDSVRRDAEVVYYADARTMRRYHDARDRQITAQCRCSSPTSPDLCAWEDALSEQGVRVCSERIWPEYVTTSLGPALACETAAIEMRSECLALACDVESCDERYEHDVDGCPDVLFAEEAAFDTALLDCIVGSPSVCPIESSGSILGEAIFTGTTIGQGDDFRSEECGGDGAPDLALRWTAPLDGHFQITTTGSKFDTVLSVYANCEDSAPLQCNDDTDRAPIDARDEASSLVAVDLVAAQEIVIVIDGLAEFVAGDFQIAITRTISD